MGDEPNIQIGVDSDGDYYIFQDERYGMPVALLELIFELQKQNPEFYEHWVSLAATYVMVGNSVTEA